MSTISEHNHDTPLDATELDSALEEATHVCPRPHSPLARSRRTRLKQRQFFGEFPFDGGTDHKDALGIPKSSLGVLNDKGTMAVPGSCFVTDPLSSQHN
jgi:hypothetical protein